MDPAITIHPYQIGFIPKPQSWFNIEWINTVHHMSKKKGEKPYGHFSICGESIWQFNIYLWLSSRELPQLIKSTHEKSLHLTSYIAISLIVWTKQGYLFSPLKFSILTESPPTTVRHKDGETSRRYKNWKRRNETARLQLCNCLHREFQWY